MGDDGGGCLPVSHVIQTTLFIDCFNSIGCSPLYFEHNLIEYDRTKLPTKEGLTEHALFCLQLHEPTIKKGEHRKKEKKGKNQGDPYSWPLEYCTIHTDGLYKTRLSCKCLLWSSVVKHVKGHHTPTSQYP